jgi:hypothetical protein
MDKSELLKQLDAFRWFENGISSDGWTAVYIPHPGMLKSGRAIYAGILPVDEVNNVLSTSDWNLEEGRDGPGLDGRGNYHRRARNDGIEPLVFTREFRGVHDPYVEVSEEFRHLFNLWEDFSQNKFYLLEDDGTETEVVRIVDQSVHIKTSLLYRYLASRQMALLLQIESDIWIPYEEDTQIPDERSEQTASYHFVFWSKKADSYLFSRLLGKRIVLPPDRTKSGIWPFRQREDYARFIIGEDEFGNPVRHTCDPLSVPSSFSVGPDAPNTLTPVFFKKDVLQKYYANPDRYQVGDGSITCGDPWLLRADTDHPEYVGVFLGDLGTDLPASEQQYWRAFELPPVGRSLSATAFNRSFRTSFAESELPEHRFKRIYTESNKEWQAGFGWPLFKELHKDDRYALISLHVPLTSSHSEFDTQMILLTKLMVDSLNEKEIVLALSGSRENGQRGIAKLDLLIDELSDGNANKPDTSVLHTIQGVRSRGAAHRKGSDFNLQKAGLNPDDLQGSFSSLLNQATKLLEELKGLAKSRSRRESGSKHSVFRPART